MILGLDISTSCTGWCILDTSGCLVDLGFIELSKIKDSYEKVEVVVDKLREVSVSYNFDRVVIEENLQAFRPGLSSAKTLLTLARFNGIIGYVVNKNFKISPEYINVNTARKKVGLKLTRGVNTKQQVFDWVNNQVVFEWPTKSLKSGPRKGQIINHPGCYDAADAYVIAKAFTLMNF